MLGVDTIKADADWLGMTQKDLAEASGVAASAICKLFSGRRRLTLDAARPLVAAIARANQERQASSSLKFDRCDDAAEVRLAG